jgi:hypothetical protein
MRDRRKKQSPNALADLSWERAHAYNNQVKMCQLIKNPFEWRGKTSWEIGLIQDGKPDQLLNGA